MPGAREFLGRMNYSDLVGSTLITLLEGDDLPPVLIPGSYKHNQQKHRIDIHGGGTILYGGFDKGVAASEMGGTGGKSSMNLTGAAIDEAVQVPESLVTQLDGAVRMKVPGLCNQIYMACNPGQPMHWIARRFGLAMDHQIMPNHYSIRTNIYDNFMLDRAFVDSFAQTLSGVAYKRYIWGLWVGSDGLVYSMFNRDIHVQDRDFEPRETVYALDPGTNDPLAIVRIDRDSDDRLHVPDEHYETGLSDSEMVEAAVAFIENKDDDLVVDNQRPGLIKDLRRAGLNATGCKKGPDSIKHGIGRVSSRLRNGKDGLPRMTISPRCVNTISEFESYEYKKTTEGYKDIPVDKNNHAMDALRYGVDRIDRGGTSYMSEEITVDGIKIPAGTDPEEYIEAWIEAAEEYGVDFDELRKDPKFGFDQ